MVIEFSFTNFPWEVDKLTANIHTYCVLNVETMVYK